jgi:hypothetical protein
LDTCAFGSICHRDANLYENIVFRKGAKAQSEDERKN